MTGFNLQGLRGRVTAPTIIDDEEDRIEDSQSELLYIGITSSATFLFTSCDAWQLMATSPRD
jgi:hypothetical protein